MNIPNLKRETLPFWKFQPFPLPELKKNETEIINLLDKIMLDLKTLTLERSAQIAVPKPIAAVQNPSIFRSINSPYGQYIGATNGFAMF